FIYTIVDDVLKLRYSWNNKEWSDYLKILLQEILDDEFKDSLSSLPPPNFGRDNFKEFVLSIGNVSEFSKFGPEILELATYSEKKDSVKLICDKFDKFYPVEFSKLGSKLLDILEM